MPAHKIDVWSHVDTSGVCWLWTGRLDENGYGRVGKKSRPAHRVVYEALVGAIPNGFELDHLCHGTDESCVGGAGCVHRRCVNPDHLEPVTHAENNRRGRGFSARNASKTHCPQGHEYTPENTYEWPGAPGRSRQCRTCARWTDRQRRARRKAAV